MDSSSPRRYLFRCAVFALAVCLARGFIYQPEHGQIWDPSITWWNGSYYAHAMYSPKGDDVYTSGWLATSTDGVHWVDGGAIAPAAPGNQWWKAFVRQIRGSTNTSKGALFIMDHGVFEPKGGNDMMRFLTSSDLRHWKVNSTSRPDPRWYSNGRWDHMYMSEDPEAGGYIGFGVSTPLKPDTFGVSVQRSEDGIHWKVQAPLNVTWAQGVTPFEIEEGGFERMEIPDGKGGSKYFLIGGASPFKMAYSMWVFSSDHIDGPYSPVMDGFRLSGGSNASMPYFGWLASWCRGPGGERLISNYITPTGPDYRREVWMLPMREPIVDSRGRLRLSYWHGNNALRSKPLPVLSSTGRVACSVPPCISAQYLATFSAAQHQEGVMLTAKLSGVTLSSGSVGLAFGDFGYNTGSDFTVLLINVGPDGPGISGSGTKIIKISGGAFEYVDTAADFPCGELASSMCGVSTVTGIDPAGAHDLLVIMRRGMFEVYLDGLLVQTFVYGGGYPLPKTGSAQVGVACGGDNALAIMSDLQAWSLSLPEVDATATSLLV